jgi:hypothetical protein
MRALLLILSAIICASPASALTLKLGGPTPRVTVYKPCETQIVVYDARPEMGISFDGQDPAVGALGELGVRIARVSLDMSLMETTEKPGLYDSTYLDKWSRLVEDCRASGICLDVAIKGDPPGAKTTDYDATIERTARFAGDMAARFPSVGYWEVGQGMNVGLSAMHAAVGGAPAASELDDPTAIGQGKDCARMLKAVYTAIKSANPAAQVVCLAQYGGFINGIYQGGGRGFFDVLCIPTGADQFSANAVAARESMAANGDESKPLWCVYEDGFDQGKLEAAFAANNNDLLYAKVLVQKAKPDESYGWLKGTSVNAGILAKPRNMVNVSVPTKKPTIAVGYEFREVEGGIEIQRVMLDSLVPTVIQLRYAPEPPPAKPGSKPVKPKPTTDPKHTPDPFDI